ncbi:Tropinesterase [compost metagenome]
MNDWMMKFTFQFCISIASLFIFLWASGCAQKPTDNIPKVEVGFIEINSNIKLRRMVVNNLDAKGTVLFLHGFPETIYSWKEIALSLGRDYEIHAFDWLGYGLSSRPPIEKFGYSPKDYAEILKEYIKQSGINSSELIVYATDIGSLPALLLALEDPKAMAKIIVGDFAPFDRPQYMHENLQNLKSKPSSDQVRAAMNKNRDEILENAYRRGFPKAEQFEISQELKDEMLRGWDQPSMTSADAFYYYYSNFTRDQNYFEANITKLKTPVKVIWGEKDNYIKKEMGIEFAKRLNIDLHVLPGIGHYPHLQNPKLTVEEINSSFNSDGK